MPNLHSSFKRVRVATRKAAHNRPIRTYTRTLVARAQAVMASGSTESVPVVQAALRQLDRAASKGIIHPNNAARHKSRLQRHLDALLQQN